jgi:hypothetical protein
LETAGTPTTGFFFIDTMVHIPDQYLSRKGDPREAMSGGLRVEQ